MIVFLYFLLITLFLILCFALCGVVLLQEGKSTGFGASFGGEASESVFGTSTADVLKQITGVMIALFFGSCIILSVWTSALNRAKVTALNPYNLEQAELEE